MYVSMWQSEERKKIYARHVEWLVNSEKWMNTWALVEEEKERERQRKGVKMYDPNDKVKT